MKTPHAPRTRRGSPSSTRWMVRLLPALLIALALLPLAPAPVALAANPAPQQVYYVSLPEDDLLQLFDDNDDNADVTFPNPVSPIRSITSISIGSTGTLVYYDQWEDGSYDADIANPGANVYANPGNLDGTQIWGDGILANGCPPSIDNVPNQCLVAADDQLQAGDVIILDNDVIVAGTSPGPYSRNPALIFFDGRDKLGVTFPVAVTRAAFPISPGSVMAGGSEVLDAGRWGTSYRAPVGENLPAGQTSAFEDVRWFIMAGTGGATISVDANGDGDYLDANDLNGVALTEGQKRAVNGIQVNATLAATGAGKVQVNSMTADVDDTFEFRWDALLPRPVWSNDYYSPVGTALKASNSGCTEVWIHNPNNSQITVNITRPGPVNATRNVPANSTVEWPAAATDLYDEGFRMYTTGTPAPVFLPIQIVDCTKDASGTDGRLYDWGNPLFPASDLTTQVLVPWAPGCSNESFLGVCRDADSTSPYTTRDVTTDGSRSVVWVTPLADTTIYVDKNGSGVNCQASPPTGAEQTIAASQLVSYRLNDNPTSRAYVRHGFGSGDYTGTDNIGQGWPQASSAWANNWTETGDEGTSGAGAFQVVTNQLRIGATGAANETGWTIRRGANLSGQTYANLRFQLRDSGLLATDRLAVEVTSDGTTWFRLGTFQGDQVGPAFDPISATAFYNISPYISANTAIRFVILNNMTGTNYWFVDNVHIDYAAGGDWDMTGSRLVTCNGVKIAAAYGQDPNLSGSNDEEALDLGTGIAPFGSAIAIDKSADKTVVAQGGLVNYSFAVTNLGSLNLMNVSVTDNRCSPAVYASGDNNPADGMLNPFPAETWIFTCSNNIFFDTTNVAFATGNDGTSDIVSAPDEWTVTVVLDAAVGNYVWLDEDGDGDQDAGEAGIPNVLVTLTGTDFDGNPVNLTTYTDANGGYLFNGVPPSNAAGYTVTVTPPAGMHQTYDEDGIGSANTSNTGPIVAGDEHLTADFGYNWAPPLSTNNPPSGATGAIGDRVWIDADGDGAQDLGEAGLGGVTVTLYHDPDGNGVYDTPYTVGGYNPVRVTDAAGNYIFDDLPAGAYVVAATPPAGYSQTGDPDQFGSPCASACDNRTTTPIVLGPGDVFVNADFGYQPTGPSGSIGDTVWLDANRNNVQNAGENGIPGVTVSLIRDLNGNGVWDVGEPIIATDITDENGQYLFNGLPIADGTGTDDYLVWVNDTNHVLGELAPTHDVRDGANQGNPASGVVTGLEISAVTNLDGTPVTNADFAYAPPGHDAGEGLIGDTIWLDRDGGGDYDPGEGLEGVRVTLTDPGPDGILGTADDTTRDTFTDENGNYYFGGLEPSLSYRVTVDTATLPAGVTNTIDPDGTFDSTTVRNLAVTGPIDLGADFAYQVTSNPNTIGGTIWEDTNADGTLTEAGVFPGVTVVLYDSNGNIVATTTTDSNGNYSFTGLPDGTYTVDVTDDNNVLNGYWHSLGLTPGADNNSQVDPYTVTVGPGNRNDTTGDFGYYVEPGAVGNRVWLDANQNGILDGVESGIAGVTVQLDITYPNGDVTTVYTVTDANGYYSFGNLLLDEDYRGDYWPSGNHDPNEPVFLVSIPNLITQPTYGATSTFPAGGTDVQAGVGSNTDDNSDNPAGQRAFPYQGGADPANDFGFYGGQLAVLLASFDATAQTDHVLVAWETVSEASNSGFNLYRSLSADGEYALLGFTPSASPGSTQGAAYSYQDFAVEAGQTYWYRLEDIDLNGAATMHDPVSVVFQAPTAVELSGLAADGGPGSLALPSLLAALLAASAAALVVDRRSAA